MESTPKLQFWKWLLKGVNGHNAGITAFWDKWILIHTCVALLCFWQDKGSLAEIAKSAILPFAGAFLGMTFAWSGNITALLTTKELSKLSNYVNGGMPMHVYTVQLSILTVFSTSIAWTLAAAEIITSTLWHFVLYFLSSIAIRECWQTILFAQYMTICRDHLSKSSSLSEMPISDKPSNQMQQ